MIKINFILFITLSLLFVVVYARKLPTIVEQVRVHEVLPSPLILKQDENNKNKYIAESAWYGSGYEDDDKVKAIMRCLDGVKVNTTSQPKIFGDHKAIFEITVPDNKDYVTCSRGIFDIDSFRFVSFTFRHNK